MAANPYGQRNDGGWSTCAECTRTFGGLVAFDMHRVTTTGQAGWDPEYDWRCATDEELGTLGLVLTRRGAWSREAPIWLTARHQDVLEGAS
jgi:hypothetical protein